MRRFLLIVDDATPEQQDAISNYLQNSQQGYWHRFTDVWLIADPTDTLVSSAIRDAMRNVVPKAHMLIFKIDDPNGWSAFGKKGDFEWLKTEWIKT